MGGVVRDVNETSTAVVAGHGGVVIRPTGDGVLALFEDAADAVRAAVAVQRALLARTWTGVGAVRVRIGLNTGPCTIHGGEVYGRPPNLASRLQSVGHGGQILVSETTATACRGLLDDDIELFDLGRYRIRGFDDVVVVFGLVATGLAAVFPPLRTAYAGWDELPAHDGVLYGRARLLDNVDRLLHDHRLVTLWGPGGIGKTRLALHFAARARRPYSDGVRFVDLTTVEAGGDVVQPVLAGLRAQPVAEETPSETVLRTLRNSRVLLVLDNCEQVTSEVRRFVDEVLASSSGPRLLATSREPLGARGEHTLEVGPLPVPEAGADAASSPAVQLFVDRAKARWPDFELTERNRRAVAEVCRAVEGVPFALELLAGRLGVEGLDSLSGSPARLPRLVAQSTTGRADAGSEEAVGSSVSTLTEPQVELFVRLGVFSGPFPRELALAMAPAGSAIDADFDRLVRRALVQLDPASGRYRLLAVVREHARRQLDAPTARALATHHAHVMLERAERFAPLLRTDAERTAVDVFSTEFAEHRTAMAHFLDAGAIGEAARLLVALFQFCLFQPRPEAHEWAGALADRIDPNDPLAPEVWGAAAVSAWFRSDTTAAIQRGLAAVRAAEATGTSVPWARTALINAFGYTGDVPAVAPHYEALVQELCGSDDPFWQVNGLGWEAISLMMFGRTESAMRRVERAFDLARRLRNPDCIQWAYYALGRVLAPTEPEAACEAYERAMEASREVDSRFHVSLNLAEWVALKRQLGDHRAAAAGARTLVDLLAVSGNRSELSRALREVAFVLVRAGHRDGAAVVLQARQRLPSMPKGAGEAAQDDQALAALEKELLAEQPRSRVVALGLGEDDLIDYCLVELATVVGAGDAA